MNNRDFIKSIRRLWRVAEGIGLGEQFSGPTPLKASEEFRGLSISRTASYEEVYLCGLKNRDYNILLTDYSFFQFGRTETTARLAFYPNPFFGTSERALSELSEKQEYVHEGIITVEDYLQEISELRSTIQPPVIRYEFDPEAYVEDRHPTAHLHIGFHSENRWPCARILSPESFGLLLVKLYYPTEWASIEVIDIEGAPISPAALLHEARRSSPEVENEYFTEDERRCFHLL